MVTAGRAVRSGTREEAKDVACERYDVFTMSHYCMYLREISHFT